MAKEIKTDDATMTIQFLVFSEEYSQVIKFLEKKTDIKIEFGYKLEQELEDTQVDLTLTCKDSKDLEELSNLLREFYSVQNA